MTKKSFGNFSNSTTRPWCYSQKAISPTWTRTKMLCRKCLSLIESQETFNDVDNLKAYLYGTVRHKCLKYLRHEEVKRRYQKYMQSEAPDETRTYEERVLEEEVYALLIKAIQNLPEQCQKVYLLVLEGKSNQEIAHQLQLNIETVKSHKQVGKKLLYDQLKHIIPVGILIFLLEF